MIKKSFYKRNKSITRKIKLYIYPIYAIIFTVIPEILADRILQKNNQENRFKFKEDINSLTKKNKDLIYLMNIVELRNYSKRIKLLGYSRDRKEVLLKNILKRIK